MDTSNLGPPKLSLIPLHTAWIVKDLDRSRQFYTELLGLEEVNRPFSYRGIWYQCAGYQLHLIEDQNYQHHTNNSDRWGRNNHIAFGVPSLELYKAKLEQAGYGVKTSASGRAAIFCSDPDGHIIEIAEV